ncbi:DUF5818 domain-containing protein [Sphingomonas leidyi]|uniref:DUF5818 domain-containing protein n=1 Tax=Sphingomonas leidyi TaxID=68569 RepID=UPI0036D2FC61
MPAGTRVRLSGSLSDSARELILALDDGSVFALDIDHSPVDLIGKRVIVEGVRSGFDRINVDWIGAA